MGYIKASDIRIFPSSSRTVSNQQGTNWLTEHNLANISEQFFTNKDGFVIEPLDGVTVGSETEVKFNIAGYYFKTTAGAIVAALNDSNGADTETTSFITFEEDSGSSIIAKITTLLKDSGDRADVSYEYLKGKDSGNTAETEAAGAVEATYTLVLFTGTKGNVAGWKVPRASRINLPNTRLDNSTLSNGATIILGEGSNSTITGGANGGTLSNVVIEDIVSISGNNSSSLTLNANSTLNVTGLVNINGSNESSSLALGASGNFLSVNKSGLTTGVIATFNNAATINSTLNVTGLTTLSGGINLSNNDITGVKTLNVTTLNVSGDTTLGTSASNKVTVNGNTTFNANATLTGHSLINGSLSGTDIYGANINKPEDYKFAEKGDSKNLAWAFKIDDGELG